jgi:hypothetical protein
MLHAPRRMDTFARYALFGCIVAGGAGGLVISIVAFKYGLIPPSEDDPIALTHRRLFVTQVAHAFAAVAFATTTTLAAVVLFSGGAASARQDRDVHAIAQRLDEVEILVRRMTETLERAVQGVERRQADRSVR